MRLGFLFAACLFAGTYAPTASTQPIQAVSALSPDERMQLPDATMVRLQGGRVASLGVLRAEHQARLARFAWAAAFADAMPAISAARTPFTRPQAMGTSANFNVARLNPNIHVVTLPTPPGAGPQAAAAPGPGTTVSAVPIASWGLAGYAKDFQAFCARAFASACIYLPPNTTFSYAFPRDTQRRSRLGTARSPARSKSLSQRSV